jgi:hypothetical protein
LVSKTVVTQTAAITSAPEPVTIQKLADLYDAVHKFDKQAGNEQAFLAKYGTRKQWLNQFKPRKVGEV